MAPAPFAPDLPYHLGKARSEDLVRRSGRVWSILHPCAYVQNFVPALCTSPPRLTVPYDVDSRFGLVDPGDAADEAERLTGPDPPASDLRPTATHVAGAVQQPPAFFRSK